MSVHVLSCLAKTQVLFSVLSSCILALVTPYSVVLFSGRRKLTARLSDEGNMSTPRGYVSAFRGTTACETAGMALQTKCLVGF